MPLYEYQCGRCGRFELIRKFSDPPLEACPTCGGPVQKQFSAPAIQFKGTGWYVTDYGRKGAGGDASSKGGETAKGGDAGKGAEKSSGSGDGNGASKDAAPKDGAGASKTTSSKDGAASGGGSTQS